MTTSTSAEHKYLTGLIIGALVTSLATIVLVAIFMGIVFYHTNKLQKRIGKLGDSAAMAAMVASGVKGLTEGLGSAIGAITCQTPPLPPIPPLDKKVKRTLGV